MSFQNSHVEVLTPGKQSMTAFADRAFEEVTELKEGP